MKVNWKKFLMLFGLFQVVFLMCGCGAWLGAVSALMPAAEATVSAILSFVLSLEGKTVPASVSAAIQKIGAAIQDEITNLQTLIAQFKANASTGLLSQISAVLQAIVANLASILSAGQITDTSTVSKLTAIVGLAVAAFQAILGLIPLASATMNSGVSAEALQAQDKEAAVHINNAHKGLQASYKLIRDTATPSANVNAALLELPKSLP